MTYIYMCVMQTRERERERTPSARFVFAVVYAKIEKEEALILRWWMLFGYV